jgi:hypothetical protein
LRTLDEAADLFQFGFGILGAYAQKHGHSRVPLDYRERSFGLGTWVNNRRNDYKAGRLSRGKVNALESLSGWTWEPRSDDYRAGVDALRRFVDEQGHARVPTECIEDGLNLGGWVARIRQLGKRGKLTPAQVSELEALPGWVWDARRYRFLEALGKLEAYARRTGHCRVPHDHTENGFKLGQWVSQWRERYRNGTLDPEQTSAFEGITGWSWKPHEQAFQRGLESLQRFVDSHNHAHMPTTFQDEEFKLGLWLAQLRSKAVRGEVKGEYLQELNRIAPEWRVGRLEALFRMNLAVLRRYAECHGHTRVPQGYVFDNVRLGNWVFSRRQAYRKGKLSRQRIDALERLAGWTWDPNEEDFGIGLEAVRDYVNEHGHSGVPTNYRHDDMNLGAWVVRRRSEYRRGKLSPDRIAALEAIPRWVWDAREAKMGDRPVKKRSSRARAKRR